MKLTIKEQKLAALRMVLESRYGNYVPTEESEAEIAKIYQEAVDKVNK